MLASIQYPIADLRSFLKGQGNRLTKPDWPPNLGTGISQPFVRSFGAGVPRYLGADAAWLDETSFYRANRAIRFHTSKGNQFTSPQALRSAFRRLFFDGTSVARVEIGLDTRNASKKNSPLDLLEALIQVPTIVPDSNAEPDSDQFSAQRPLIQQGLHLARLYSNSTIRMSDSAAQALAKEFVIACGPLIVLECTPNQMAALPSYFVRIDPKEMCGVEVCFGRIRRYNGELGVWLINSRLGTPQERRSVRLCLLRHHAETEVLQTTLSKLRCGELKFEPRTTHGDKLEEYLNKATKILNANLWRGVHQSAVRNVIFARDATHIGQDIQRLNESLSGARRQILKKVEIFIEQHKGIQIFTEQITMNYKTITFGDGARVSAPIIIADTVENCLNQIQSGVSDDLVGELMEDLLREIAEAADSIPTEGSEELARDVKSLTDEISSGKPRKSGYEFFIQNIEKTAGIIGDVGKPILKTVGKLLPVLVGLFP